MTSFSFSPPPLTWRRASPVEGVRPALTKAVSTPRPAANSLAATVTVGRLCASTPSSKVLRRRFRGGFRRLATVQQGGRLVGQHLFRLVDLGALKRGELGDLVERQRREQFQEPRNVGVLGIAPILPIIVDRSMSELSQTAPAAVLPILAPEAVVSSGEVRA